MAPYDRDSFLAGLAAGLVGGVNRHEVIDTDVYMTQDQLLFELYLDDAINNTNTAPRIAGMTDFINYLREKHYTDIDKYAQYYDPELIYGLSLPFHYKALTELAYNEKSSEEYPVDLSTVFTAWTYPPYKAVNVVYGRGGIYVTVISESITANFSYIGDLSSGSYTMSPRINFEFKSRASYNGAGLTAFGTLALPRSRLPNGRYKFTFVGVEIYRQDNNDWILEEQDTEGAFSSSGDKNYFSFNFNTSSYVSHENGAWSQNASGGRELHIYYGGSVIYDYIEPNKRDSITATYRDGESATNEDHLAGGLDWDFRNAYTLNFVEGKKYRISALVKLELLSHSEYVSNDDATVFDLFRYADFKNRYYFKVIPNNNELAQLEPIAKEKIKLLVLDDSNNIFNDPISGNSISVDNSLLDVTQYDHYEQRIDAVLTEDYYKKYSYTNKDHGTSYATEKTRAISIHYVLSGYRASSIRDQTLNYTSIEAPEDSKGDSLLHSSYNLVLYKKGGT